MYLLIMFTPKESDQRIHDRDIEEDLECFELIFPSHGFYTSKCIDTLYSLDDHHLFSIYRTSPLDFYGSEWFFLGFFSWSSAIDFIRRIFSSHDVPKYPRQSLIISPMMMKILCARKHNPTTIRSYRPKHMISMDNSDDSITSDTTSKSRIDSSHRMAICKKWGLPSSECTR